MFSYTTHFAKICATSLLFVVLVGACFLGAFWQGVLGVPRDEKSANFVQECPFY